MDKIPKRISNAILNSVGSGVVPRIGLGYIAVGRRAETEVILSDLEAIAEGSAAFRIIAGRYGAGKTFLLQMVRNYAMDRDYIVCDADLSPERRLSGSRSEGLATYRELMGRLSTKTRPDGGALEAILQAWINKAVSDAAAAGGGIGSEATRLAAEEKILSDIASLEGYSHGFDFATAAIAYMRAYQLGDDETRSDAVKWLRGEFSTKRDARVRLRVGEIINDENWYEALKLFAGLARIIGYKGLIVFIDECVNLYKIPNRVSREHNYEKILTMFNDTMQG